MNAMVEAMTGAKQAALLAYLMLAALMTTPAEAGAVKAEDVTAAVETWVRQMTADARKDARIRELKPYPSEGRTLAYVAELEDGGFCLCGADDLVLPVYLYSPNGVFDADNPTNQYLLWEIGARLISIEEALANRDPGMDRFQSDLVVRRSAWTELEAGRVLPRELENTEGVPPGVLVLPFTSTWNQGSPWNMYCPLLTDAWSENTVVGCVATASAQIMRYWKWPASGQGSASGTYHYRWRPIGDYDTEPLTTDPSVPANWGSGRLRWTSTDGGQLEMMGYWDATLLESAAGINTASAYQSALQSLWSRLTTASRNYNVNLAQQYDWDLMPDHPIDENDPGAQEAAKISYHFAVGVGMDFGVSGSTASTADAGGLLWSQYFYSNDVRYESRDVNTIVHELRYGRPVQFRATRTTDDAGHSWVVYGYNTGTTPTQLLMHFGWGGTNDGWYSCDNINGDWNSTQRILKHIAPADVVRFVYNGGFDGDGSPASVYSNLENALADAPDETTLIMYAGETQVLPGTTAIIDKPITLKGHDVLVIPGG